VPIRGVTNAGFIPPKQLDADTSLYNVFYKYDFVFNPARMELNSISLNLEYDQAICSSLYEIFYVNNADELLPEYLNLFIKRDEFARFCWYDAIGSARNYFRVANLQEILFPLPNIDIQHELVDTYNGLKALAEQNEALIKPLTDACQAYIVDCKRNYPEVELGEYIEECKIKNNENIYGVNELQGVTSNSIFDKSKADTNGLSFDNYKIVHINEFAYNPSRINIGSIAMQTKSTCIISPMYIVFKLLSELILPDYLQILFSRKEFQRSTLFYAMGSVRDTFDFNLMKEVKVPLPPHNVQQAIVDIYICAEEAKKIANDAREKMKNLCPALVQRAINV
jgi:type I restriction enzyme S subunit